MTPEHKALAAKYKRVTRLARVALICGDKAEVERLLSIQDEVVAKIEALDLPGLNH